MAGSNDVLVDSLVKGGLIKSSQLERVFRAVHRASYFNFTDRPKGTAWIVDLTSPSLYSKVMEGLDLQSGMFFLNVGSGTGYLSTMAGLLLGKNGANQGIDVYPEVVKYARKKLEQFLKTSPATHEFDFCPPEFTIGNFLETFPVSKRYDRIYCGEPCLREQFGKFFNMLKVGGVCVLIVDNYLWKITRLGDNSNMIDRRKLMPVVYSATATLLPPSGSRAELPPLKCKGLAVRTLSQLMSLPTSEVMKHLACAMSLEKPDLIHWLILEYINNSQEPSHSFGIQVKSIIKIQRKYNDGFDNLLFLEKSRMMLWHGTPIKNLSSILGNGLTLPPPYQGGLLQGRAIYFADRASKSAQYCDERRRPSPGQDGILLLCDVMVGTSHIPDNPDHKLTRPPQGFDSVTCPGRRAPSTSTYQHIDGVIFPSGKSSDNQIHSNCMVEFNEYAIYDPDLIDIKYIVHFTFTGDNCSN